MPLRPIHLARCLSLLDRVETPRRSVETHAILAATMPASPIPCRGCSGAVESSSRQSRNRESALPYTRETCRVQAFYSAAEGTAMQAPPPAENPLPANLESDWTSISGAGGGCTRIEPPCCQPIRAPYPGRAWRFRRLLHRTCGGVARGCVACRRWTIACGVVFQY